VVVKLDSAAPAAADQPPAAADGDQPPAADGG
jgi:hypothetical protein